MPIQVITPTQPKKLSFTERLSEGLGRGLEAAQQYSQQQQQMQQRQQAAQKLGIDPDVFKLPEQAQAEYFKNAFSKEKGITPLQQSQLLLNEEKLKGLQSQQKLFDKMNPPEEYIENEVAEEISKPKKGKGLSQVSDDILRQIAAFKGQPGEAGIRGNMAQAELDARMSKQTASEKQKLALRQETLPIRTEIAKKAMAATQGIQNKQQLMNLIEKGNIDDPTYAALAESLPLNLGKRMLSNDTIEYKAGMIEEFGDLKNIFPGQVRVKEIELLEQKMADLYLTDDQKKAILRSRINALKADEIRAEVAQEIENEPLGILQFQNELEKRSKPRLEAIFNQILDEQKSIIQNAENRKKVPLDPKDPEDYKIMQQIKKEAGGDKAKAQKIAREKGYTW
jgi:hypothetical protein